METVLLIFVIISILAFIFVLVNNKYQLTIIKLDKAEEDIDIYLEKKKDLLSRTTPIVKKELKIKEFIENENNWDDEFNNFEKHNFLKGLYNELFKTIDENDKLTKSDSLVKILEELNDNEEDIVGAIKYYNDSVVEFNKLVVSFPSNIVALIKGYKKLEFYNNEKREIFEILNQK